MRRQNIHQANRHIPANNYDMGSLNNAAMDQNVNMTEDLIEKVQVLKSLSIDIGAEVKYQENLIRNFESDIDNTSGILNNTIFKVLSLKNSNYFRLLFILILFCALVLGILYFRIKSM